MTTPVKARALEMRLRIRNLMQAHHVQQEPAPIPLTMATPYPMILEGYASTIDLDLDRTKIRGWAFGPPHTLRNTPLLWKHDPDQVAGVIEDIDYDAEGNLLVRATVHHPLARRAGAFSIGARVNDYEMINADRSDFYAIITSAELTEISLTDTPSNTNALVMDRHPVSPRVQSLELISAKVEKLVQLTQFIKERSNAHVH